ncbi:GNAT family N-acetyltransferase, partial [Rhodopirellula bahusiensis]
MNTASPYLIGPETERLVHRAFTVDDAELAFELNSNPDVLRYTGDSPLNSAAQARQFIADYPDFREFGYGRWACVLKETQTVVGFCGPKYLPNLDVVDIGYHFLPDHWGRGIATEACTACLKFCLEVIGMRQIVAFVIPENIASIRVLEKSGMTYDCDFNYDGIATHRFVLDI